MSVTYGILWYRNMQQAGLDLINLRIKFPTVTLWPTAVLADRPKDPVSSGESSGQSSFLSSRHPRVLLVGEATSPSFSLDLLSTGALKGRQLWVREFSPLHHKPHLGILNVTVVVHLYLSQT